MLFYFVQRITCLVCYLLGKLFLHLDVKGLENIKLLSQRGVIFISNHNSKWDSFLIASSLPPSYLKVIKRLRFMAYPKYTDDKWYGGAIRLFGAYPVYRNSGGYNKALKNTITLLEDGQSLVMFPTGRISSNFMPSEARPGIAYLARKLNSLMIPVYVAGTYEIKLSEFLLRKRRVQVNFGKPFYVNEAAGNGEDLRAIAKKIMARVGDLALPAQIAAKQPALKFVKPAFDKR